MIRVAEDFDQFASACKYKNLGDRKPEDTNKCEHPKCINPICLDKKYCPRVEAVAKKQKERPEWWDNFTVYCQIHEEQYHNLTHSTEWIKEMQSIYPDVDILKSMEKCRREYWLANPKEKPGKNGWEKRRGKCITLDFATTYKWSLSQTWNQVKISQNRNITKGKWIE